jgi:hypothetical protein
MLNPPSVREHVWHCSFAKVQNLNSPPHSTAEQIVHRQSTDEIETQAACVAKELPQKVCADAFDARRKLSLMKWNCPILVI